jgi:tetratricopeptide (TPR) repeat protein
VFCLLAQHPLGCGIDVHAARALPGISQVHKHLRELCEAAVLRPDAGNGPPPQYKMHQLLREYASGLVPGTITSAEADSAAERLFRHYWRTAEELVALAEPYLSRHTRPGAAPASAAAPGLVSSAPQATVRWFKAQRELLLACIDQAADRHLDHWVVCLTSVMAGFLRNNGPWDQAIDRHAAAAHAAARLGDRVAQGVALNHLAITCRLAGRYDQALTVLPQVHAIFTGPLPADVPARDVWLGQANALNEQGIVHNEQGDHDAATLALRAALSLYQKADDHIGMANSNKNLGVALFHAGLGSYDTSVCAEALQRLSDAMAGYAAINDELGLAEVANHRGRLHLHTGDISDAMADFQHALRMVRETASLVEEARAKEGIGSCYLATGARDQARPYLDAAGHIYTEIRAQGRAGRADTSSARL